MTAVTGTRLDAGAAHNLAAVGRSVEERREELVKLYRELHEDHGCPLAAARTHVVFGMGNADADLMFVGEAPGRNEDLEGKPFVGQAGKLLDVLLAEIGLQRNQVFIARSAHAGGVNVGFFDGSVRFVKDSINIATWRGLSSSQGSEVISADSY